MHEKHWQLLAVLADGGVHHIGSLAKIMDVRPQAVNGLWQQMPPHIRGLLRQHDGQWRLIRPLAVFDRELVVKLGQKYGFQTALSHETHSTNDDLLAQAKVDPNSVHRMLKLAHHQTAGRGRQGRQWQQRLGECLMLSLGWVSDKPQQELGALALVVALAAYRALQKLSVPVSIKWPNDLVVGAEKLGGILIETVRAHSQTIAVIGMGINFVIPKDVEAATSIQTASAAPSLRITAMQVLDTLLAELAILLPQYEQEGFEPMLAEYEAANRDQGKIVRLLHHGHEIEQGKVLGVTANGALRLECAAGEREMVIGEISLRPSESEIMQPNEAAQEQRYLLLDAGNSQLKWAWVANGVIEHIGRAPYRDLKALGEEWYRRGGNVPVIGSAVSGEAKKALVAAQLDVPIQWLGSMSQALGVRNHYWNVAEHGADRWFNVLGSRRFTQNAAVVVSCGTAVTVDALTADNHYLGGTIMPGFHLMKEAMASKTAHLNRPIGKVYPFPTTTSNALASGMMDAVCGSIMLMHSRLQAKNSGQPVDVVITGGGAAKVAQAMPEIFAQTNQIRVVDNLVLYGLLHWVEHRQAEG